MADAVLTQRLLIGGAALALLFLIVLLLVAGFWLLATIVDRYRQADAKVAEILAEPAPARAVLDIEPGINLALQDDCELLFNMPAYEPADPELATGCDLLRQAIRDEQQKGDRP